ncbi:MAG: TonB-dependent receptor, partial [Pseudomonadota bacterium]
QGRNALAGAAVVNTVNPGDDFTADFQLEAAEFNSYRTSGALTVPIAPGQVSLRVAGDYLQSDGFVNNTFLDRDDIDESDALTARATLLVTPDFAPDFTARFGLTYTDAEEGENRVIESVFRDTGERVSNQNNIDRQTAEAYIASANLSYEFTPELTLTSITSYIDTNSSRSFDPDNSNPVETPLPLPGGAADTPIVQFNDDEVFTQELRLTYESDNLSVLLGGYYFDSTGNLNSDSATVVATDFAFPDPGTLAFVLGLDVPTATFLRGQVVAAVPAFPVNLINQSTTDLRNLALFGEATWDISEKVSITLGARYDNERVRQDIVNGTLVPPLPSAGDPTIDALLGQVATQFSNVFNFNADTTFEAFLPKAGIVYNFTDDVSLGFTYQRAYRAGGLAFNTFRASLAPEGSDQAALEAAGIVNPFDPEFSNNYEVSFRSVWGDGDFVLNANGYIIDYTDQLIFVQLSSNPLDTITDNAGASRLTGFEIEATMYPTEGLSLFANIGYADTIFTDGAGTLGNDITDFQFLSAPDITVGFGGRYEHDSGFYLNMQNRLTGGAFTSFNDINDGVPGATERVQDPTGQNDPGFTVDLNIGYEAANFTIEVFARNLFNERFFTFDVINDPVDPTNPGAGFIPNDITTAIANTPQQFGVRLTGSF